ncbi:hypothetical protein P154DRAFT_472219 [Amniculicola lignicola CBS 123094]|uniref:Copper acquisition factor BIM1-like domain-containing protein n=1 Tax=Amniculicola lignicola CBS 123094 TaxID=1392246 RepID=A0A6A5W6I2_9PLEO|nr:hypothetical protein P154DRAFT_472219 [Amniculicola lignicola CBS 123094]
MSTKTAIVVGLAAVARAHFFLQDPPYIGFADDTMTVSPCGGFDSTSREGASDFSVGGAAISVITTHSDVTWEYHAALVSNPSKWVTIYPTIHQRGVGDFCLTSVPGVAAWAGQDAVIQVIQHAHDGDLHQCAAVRFVSGGPESVPGSCRNGTGVSATFVGGSAPSATTPPIASSPEPSHEHSEDHEHSEAPETTGAPDVEPPSTAATITAPSSEASHDHDHEHPTSGASDGHGHSHPTPTSSSEHSHGDDHEHPSETGAHEHSPSATGTGGHDHEHPNGTTPTSPTVSSPAEFTGAASALKVSGALGGLLGVIGLML